MEAIVRAHMPVMGDHMDGLRHRWDTEYLPALLRLTDEIDGLDFGGDDASAAAALDRLVAINGRSGASTS